MAITSPVFSAHPTGAWIVPQRGLSYNLHCIRKRGKENENAICRTETH